MVNWKWKNAPARISERGRRKVGATRCFGLARGDTRPTPLRVSRLRLQSVEKPVLQSRDGELHLPAHPRHRAEKRQPEVAAPAEQAALGLEKGAERLGKDAEVAGVRPALGSVAAERFRKRRPREMAGQALGVEQGEIGSLPEVRAHGMGGVAGENHPA